MPSTSESRPAGEESDDDPLARLKRADTDRRVARSRVEDAGEDTLCSLRAACAELRDLLDRYDGRATGDEDFKAFIEFQEEVAKFTNRLDDDLPEYETFESIDDDLQKRKLRERDFERARERIGEIEETVAPLDDWEDARDRYETARLDVHREIDRTDDRIDDLERLLELGEADLDAPVERLQEPIETYDDAVSEAFARFRGEAPAREVLDFVETTALYPLVPFREPPEDLLTFVREAEAGTESISRLLELADFSRSKLDHYVADVDELKRNVATQQTYLRRLDAEPLTVGWPPPAADVLRWQCDERISVVDRFAPEVVPHLRAVRELTRRDDYERLRESALAREELSEDELDRLQRGEVENELAAARKRRAALTDALEEYPELEE